MPAFSQTFCNRLLVLLLTLIGSVLGVHAQQTPQSSSAEDTDIRIIKVASISESSTALKFGSAGYAQTRMLIAPAAESPQQPQQTQGSGGNVYVFPSKDQRFKRFVWNTIGPFSVLGAGASAAVSQWQKNPPEWGQGASGYGKRFASNLGGNAIQQTVSYGLSEALGLDTGFEKSKRRGFGARLVDALAENVTSRTHSGKRIISTPRLVGYYVGGLVPVLTWYPSRYGYKDGLRSGTYSLAAGFAVNVLREFIFHK
jgi:hypothetical protein